jgi:hypothetical protein
MERTLALKNYIDILLILNNFQLILLKIVCYSVRSFAVIFCMVSFMALISIFIYNFSMFS